MAEEPIFGLTRKDLDFIKKHLGYVKGLKRNPDVPTNPIEVPYSAGLYVAKIPSTGINGLDYASSGTGSGTGTGTGRIDRGPANSAVCKIYKRDLSSTAATPGNLIPTGFEETVYNVGQSKLYGPQFVPVILDRYGTWVATSNGRDTEFLKVVAAKVGGWQFAYTVDYDLNSDTYSLKNFVQVKEAGNGEFDLNSIILDAHLVGVKDGYLSYLASLSAGTTETWAEIIDEPGPGTGTLPGTGAILSDWYAAYLGDWVNCEWVADTGTVVAVKSPNGYPLKIGSKGRVTYICTTGGYDRYLGEAEHWDYRTCVQ